jgi:hypothetical protein
MAQVVESLPSKEEAQSSNPRPLSPQKRGVYGPVVDA